MRRRRVYYLYPSTTWTSEADIALVRAVNGYGQRGTASRRRKMILRTTRDLPATTAWSPKCLIKYMYIMYMTLQFEVRVMQLPSKQD